MTERERRWEENRKLYEQVNRGQEGCIRFRTLDTEAGENEKEPVEAAAESGKNSGSVREYVRLFAPHQRLILLGGGHISCELCRLAAWLDFEVTVVDDRPEFAAKDRFPQAAQVICGEFGETVEMLKITSYDFVAIMTRGHAGDEVCLKKILEGTMPAYLGMVGSRRKTALVREHMLALGFSESLLDRVEAPIGLAIGARTPGEIGVSILGQLIAYRNRSVKKAEGLLDGTNSDKKLLAFMAGTEAPYVLAVAVEKSGSGPVSTGALMVVDETGIQAGTVGGGRGEFEAAQAAAKALRCRRSAMVTVNMTNREAGDTGMICGGTLKIWLEYCGPGGREEEREQ